MGFRVDGSPELHTYSFFFVVGENLFQSNKLVRCFLDFGFIDFATSRKTFICGDRHLEPKLSAQLPECSLADLCHLFIFGYVGAVRVMYIFEHAVVGGRRHCCLLRLHWLIVDHSVESNRDL